MSKFDHLGHEPPDQPTHPPTPKKAAVGSAFSPESTANGLGPTHPGRDPGPVTVDSTSSKLAGHTSGFVSDPDHSLNVMSFKNLRLSNQPCYCTSVRLKHAALPLTSDKHPLAILISSIKATLGHPDCDQHY